MIPTVPSNQVVFAMSPEHPPVLCVADGSRVRFETCDCFADQIRSADDTLNNLDWNRINPATGPVFVEGAEPGDTLRVHIRSIELGRQAVLATLPNAGVAGARIKESRIDIVPVEDGHAVLFGTVRLPLNPMIGVIGTAPAGEAVSCGTPDAHGGNMDSKIITAGTTLLLPVNVAGALLAMGDLHAGMGDGEVGLSGLEINGTVEVEVSVIKDRPYPLPLAVTADYCYTIASHPDLDSAAETAVLMATDLLCAHSKLDINQAAALQSIAGDLQVCQVVDPNKTCRFALPRAVTDQLGIRLP
ncbi:MULTISPECIES: acetamidase/formamidase family protein [unclassified Neisseria]|uniref:acetamidase/formamidase family protein n=1 Tax=unclassified Neisseria TaxID=2623750 RepID=UPI002665E022|nr:MULTISPECIES: acetamidase/formamidase family protein [unclassified Neisseria]MDO1509845.1 acetamidase/formamidase family protein [Neisseria sp. MVDL19-042950]MDO1516042.1 acetamidase/formamidase family protein [Neisseria sp. MVDL18-041461]MDO1563158.1 acetamidase/formamidase family protein [Neisseria sp. MVDL20-010259]